MAISSIVSSEESRFFTSGMPWTYAPMSLGKYYGEMTIGQKGVMGPAVDCSHFVQEALLSAGYNVAYYTSAAFNQILSGKLSASDYMPAPNITPGDVVVFGHHVGIVTSYDASTGLGTYDGAQSERSGVQKNVSFNTNPGNTNYWGGKEPISGYLTPTQAAYAPVAATTVLDGINKSVNDGLQRAGQNPYFPPTQTDGLGAPAGTSPGGGVYDAGDYPDGTSGPAPWSQTTIGTDSQSFASLTSTYASDNSIESQLTLSKLGQISGTAYDVKDANTGSVPEVDIDFGNHAGLVQIDNPQAFSGTIYRFAPGATVDLAGTRTQSQAPLVAGSPMPATASLGAGNVLMVQGAGANYALQLDPAQNFRGESFVASPDGSGGTNVRVASLVGVDGAGEIVGVNPGSGATTPLSSSQIGPFSLGGEAAIDGKFYVLGGPGLYKIDEDTGQVSSKSSAADNLVADSSTGSLFSVQDQGVFKVDPASGGLTRIASVPGVQYIALGGEAALNGNVYFASADGNLYTVNEKTGTASSVTTGASNFVADDTTGKLVGVNAGTVYSVDPASGKTTPIAEVPNLGGVAVGGEAAQGGYFYAAGQSGLYTVNITTGEVSIVSGGPSNFVAMQQSDVACFVSGTSIMTARGNIAVENLAAGDRVVTARGDQRPVRWGRAS